MKYYLPTTTLNFSNILSSEAISPAFRYRGRTLGFRHFELSLPNPCQDYLFIYDCPMNWTTDFGCNDNYPLILELDESVIPQKKLSVEPVDQFEVLAIPETIYLSPLNVRFLFRSEDEMKRMLLRVTGTLENKCDNLYKEKNCFSVLPTKPLFAFNTSMQENLLKWTTRNSYDHAEAVRMDIWYERMNGAQLGASVGTWLLNNLKPDDAKSKKRIQIQQALSFYGILKQFSNFLAQLGIPEDRGLGALANELPPDYRPQGRYLLSQLASTEQCNCSTKGYPILEEVLKFILARGNVDWRWEGTSLVEFCRSVWIEVLNPVLSKEKQFEVYRDSFNRLLRNLQQAEAYSISEENSPFLQAFAAFLGGGRDAGKLARLLVAEKVKRPDIALTLYGAVVGYTRFPRTLLELDSYEAKVLAEPKSSLPEKDPKKDVLKKPNKKQPEKYQDAVLSDEPKSSLPEKDLKKNFSEILKKKKFAKKYLDALLSNDFPVNKIQEWRKMKPFPKDIVKSFIDDFLETNGSTPCGQKVKAETAQQMLLTEMCVNEARPNLVARLFVEDDSCGRTLCQDDRIKKEISFEKRSAIAQSLVLFQKEYEVGGYYAGKPSDYQRDNASTADHFIKCLSSPGTKKFNVRLTDSERTTLVEWLKTRYGY
jgi:hypothetical protein